MHDLAGRLVAGMNGAHRDGALGHFIAGRAVDGAGAAFAVTDPSTRSLLGQAHDATDAELEAAISAARDAFPAWSRTAPEERRAILNRVADMIVARADEIAAVECLDSGQCIRFMA